MSISNQMNKNLRSVIFSVLLLLCGVAVGIAYKSYPFRELSKSKGISTNSEVHQNFPLMHLLGEDFWFYRVPKPVLERMAVVMQSHALEGNLVSVRGECRAFGVRIYLSGRVIYWYANIVLSGESLYQDTSGLLAEYSQYLALLDSDVKSFGLRWSELEGLVTASGHIDENKLTDEQRRIILSLRDDLKKRK